MPLIRLDDINVTFGSETIFDKLNLNIYPGDKIGLVGPNGCGKTTLMKMITKSISPDLGQITRKKMAKVSYLAQEPTFSGHKTMLEELHDNASDILIMQKQLQSQAEKISIATSSELKSVMAKYDKLAADFQITGGYEYEIKLREVTAALGLNQKLLEMKTNQLSGGQLSRLGLAKVLVDRANLLLLDEPTNHLDWDTTMWLEKFLKNTNASLIIVSHDRFLLEQVTTKIVEISQRKTFMFKGNYSAYKKQKSQQDQHQQKQFQQNKEFLANTQVFIEKNRNLKGMQKVARGRQKQLDRLLKQNPDFLNKPASHQKKLKFEFQKVNAKTQKEIVMLKCDKLTMKYGDMTLFEDVNIEVPANRKLGIIGPNGSGKTTLLKLILKQISPTNGTVKLKTNAEIGYLDQTADQLNPKNTVLEELATVDPTLLNAQLRSKLGQFLFSNEDVFKQVGDLSGGEKNRLALCKIVLQSPQILLLDEPTNHLDIPSIEALEAALKQYKGSVFTVSHDRFFLDNVTDQILVIGADAIGQKSIGKHEYFKGHFKEYIKTIEKRARENKTKENHQAKPKKNKKSKKDKPRKSSPPELKQFNIWTIEKAKQSTHR